MLPDINLKVLITFRHRIIKLSITTYQHLKNTLECTSLVSRGLSYQPLKCKHQNQYLRSTQLTAPALPSLTNQWEVPALLPELGILMNIRRKQAAKSTFTSPVQTHAGGNLLLMLLLLLQKVIGLGSGFFPSESVRKREDST